jgi:hypothetical protein
MLIGALLGCALGAFVILTLAAGEADTTRIFMVLGATAGGAMLGAWGSSMVGAAIPNSRLAAFGAAIEAGRILIMIDVPQRRVEEVRERLRAIHPEVEDCGLDPHVPAFP